MNDQLFQFLIGRLKTERETTAEIKNGLFQFLIGRLKTTYGVFENLKNRLVSIPHR